MVKYEWDESNGVSVPTNKLMVIDADEYYVGMPLRKVDAETVAPTDGDPEYICLAQRNAGDEIRPLQIPVQEVFPDAVYTKILEDGTEEKVKFGGGGKIKPEQLPDGYPYEETVVVIEEQTTATVSMPDMGGIAVSEIAFTTIPKAGDAVDILFNGENYRCIVFDSLIGNMSILGAPDDTGEPFIIFINGGHICTNEPMEITISAGIKKLKKLDNKFLQDNVAVLDSVGDVITIEWDGDTTGLQKFVCNGFNYYKVTDVVIPFEHIAHAHSRGSDNHNEEIFDEKEAGTNCYDLRHCIVVTKAGDCVDSDGNSFYADSVGVYCIKHNFTTGEAWCDYVEIDSRRENAVLHLTNPSGVKYAITVDDNGTITATEV